MTPHSPTSPLLPLKGLTGTSAYVLRTLTVLPYLTLPYLAIQCLSQFSSAWIKRLYGVISLEVLSYLFTYCNHLRYEYERSSEVPSPVSMI